MPEIFQLFWESPGAGPDPTWQEEGVRTPAVGRGPPQCPTPPSNAESVTPAQLILANLKNKIPATPSVQGGHLRLVLSLWGGGRSQKLPIPPEKPPPVTTLNSGVIHAPGC